MTRGVLFTLLSVGCAAAVPAAHEYFGGHDSALHAGLHAAPGNGSHDRESMEAWVDSALDGLGLAPETRAKAKQILKPRLDEAIALHAKIASGEIDHDTAMAQHERIVSAASADLAVVLTPEQIQRLFEALHPQGARLQDK